MRTFCNPVAESTVKMHTFLSPGDQTTINTDKNGPRASHSAYHSAAKRRFLPFFSVFNSFYDVFEGSENTVKHECFETLSSHVGTPRFLGILHSKKHSPPLVLRWCQRWLVGWLAGWLVGWLAGWLVGWLVGLLTGWLVGWLVAWLLGKLEGWFVG